MSAVSGMSVFLPSIDPTAFPAPWEPHSRIGPWNPTLYIFTLASRGGAFPGRWPRLSSSERIGVLSGEEVTTLNCHPHCSLGTDLFVDQNRKVNLALRVPVLLA